MTGHTEIQPGLYRLEQTDATRINSQYIVQADEMTVIVDAGLPDTPATAIVPVVEGLDGQPRPITLVLTHPDADHCGGTASLRAALPQLHIISHADDRPLVGNPGRTLSDRYESFSDSDDIALEPRARARIVGRMGAPFTVDEYLANECVLAVHDPSCTVLHLPGHSLGHLGVWLPGSRTLISGDAIMGRGIPNSDGSLLYPPQFLAPSLYLGTIERIRELNVRTLLCAHEAPITDEAVTEFLDVSAAAVSELESAVLSALRQGPGTLSDICRAVAQTYAGFGRTRWQEFTPSVAGILEELEGRHTLVIDGNAQPRKFMLNGE